MNLWFFALFNTIHFILLQEQVRTSTFEVSPILLKEIFAVCWTRFLLHYSPFFIIEKLLHKIWHSQEIGKQLHVLYFPFFNEIFL